MEIFIQVAIAITGYLLGMAFAGSFIGRKWMGMADIALHRIFKREITKSKYLYWKHFCGIGDPPKPESLRNPNNLIDKILCKFL